MKVDKITFHISVLVLWIAMVRTEERLGEVISQLQQEYDFQCILYFIIEVTKNQRILVLDKIDSVGKDIPTLILNQTYVDLDIREEFNSNILSVVFITESNKDLALEVVTETLDANFHSKVIFDFFTETYSIVDLEVFMQWLWSERIINSLVIMNNHSYIFNPYPYLTITEIASDTALKPIFEGKLANLHKSNVTVIEVDGAPRTMKYIDRKGNIQHAGYIMKTILAFISKYNGTLYEHIPNITKDIPGITQHLNSRESDLLPLMAMGFEGNMRITNPVTSVDYCLIMPYQQELPRVYYLMLPFQTSVWILLIIALLILLLVLVVADILLGTNSYSAFQYAFFHVLRLITQQLHFRIRFLKNRWILVIHLLAILLFTLLGSLYQSELSSFYTKSVPAEQITYYSDLKKFDYKILVNPEVYDVANMLVALKMFPRSLLNYFTKDISSHKKLSQLNTDYGYLVGEDELKLFEELQDRSSTKYFFRSKICLMKTLICMAIQKDYPFEHILNDIILRMAESGLIEKWEKDFLYESIEARCFKMNLSYESSLRPLKIKDLYVAWLLFSVGILVGLFTFCGEKVRRLVSYKLKGNKGSLKRRR
ncbi:unnamed protein product [Hermetia illucens]|uniref:Ionotropic receptor n=1 Tax=Hermetia illucens TaxID=343691 RepID=A0A7R8UI23_HERIL|nr:unnamed protein product [Hermetia illucens]